MSNYENGVFTRQAIVQACKRLFYEKGFHETSYADICRLAHVNRGTIYYHFKTKEAMRYEVLWEFITDNKHTVEKYCPDNRYYYLLSMALLWRQAKLDRCLRGLFLQCCIDTPVYTGKLDTSYFYERLMETMWSPFFDTEKTSELSFVSAYGYIMSFFRMFCEHPEKYDALEIFRHCADCSISIWGFPHDQTNEIWQNAKNYLALIPGEELVIKVP